MSAVLNLPGAADSYGPTAIGQSLDEVDPFMQLAPGVENRWLIDPALRQAVKRLVEDTLQRQPGESADLPGLADEVDRVLTEVGLCAAQELAPLAQEAERVPPRLVPYDPWGNRVDRIEVSAAWPQLVQRAQQLGLVALAYERPFGAASRIVQAAAGQLVDPLSATALCPLSMTDAAAGALARHDPDLARQWVPRLTARYDGWTSGQWMTEKQGGSDVSRSGTTATLLGNGRWALRGTK